MLRTKLSVNLNKVALLRNSREGNWPDPVFFGRIALEAGAAGLTVHPRPDERHVRATDVPAIAALVSEYPDREYNIEGNPFHNLMGHLEAVRPDQATFVPDSLGQKTSDHGFDLSDPAVCDAVRPLIAQAKAWGCRVRRTRRRPRRTLHGGLGSGARHRSPGQGPRAVRRQREGRPRGRT